MNENQTSIGLIQSEVLRKIERVKFYGEMLSEREFLAWLSDDILPELETISDALDCAMTDQETAERAESEIEELENRVTDLETERDMLRENLDRIENENKKMLHAITVTRRLGESRSIDGYGFRFVCSNGLVNQTRKY